MVAHPDHNFDSVYSSFRTQSGDQPKWADLRSLGPASIARIALLLSDVSLVGDFQPDALFPSVNRVWHEIRPIPDASFTRLGVMACFEEAVATMTQGHECIAVTVSGGLDSFAVLRTAIRLWGRHKRYIALTASIEDERGRSSVGAACNLIGLLEHQCEHVVITNSTGEQPLWTPKGPRMEAMPRLTRALNDAADAKDATILLLGTGADSLLGCPRFCLGKLGQFGLRRWVSYLRETVTAGFRPTAYEALSIMAPILSPRLSATLYWAVNWPDLCGVGTRGLLSSDLEALVFDWTRTWMQRRLNALEERADDWAELDAWECATPCEVFPPSGQVQECSPYHQQSMVLAAMRLPLIDRYSSSDRTPYHRQKSIVLDLIGRDISPNRLPQAKQLFTTSYAAQSVVRAEALQTCIDFKLVIPDRLRGGVDPKTANRLMAIESWLRGAVDRGVSIDN